MTCGGVALSNVTPSTLECRLHPGLYFAGEVLDVDAITEVSIFRPPGLWRMWWQRVNY